MKTIPKKKKLFLFLFSSVVLAFVVFLLNLDQSKKSNNEVKREEVEFIGEVQEEINCKENDRNFIIENGLGKTREKLEVVILSCLEGGTISKIYKSELAKNQVRLDYVGFGSVFLNENGKTVRVEGIISDGDDQVLSELINEYGEYDFEEGLEPSQKQQESNIKTSGRDVKYSAFVWLDDGIMVIGFEDAQGNIRITFKSRFLDSYSESKEEFMDKFISEPETKIKSYGVEI